MTRTKTRALANWPNNGVSVLDFGAVGDGVTDDTAAIQAAIDYAETQVLKRLYGGFSVYFPNGAYLISSTLTLEEAGTPSGGSGENGVSLVGEGATSSSIIANNPTFDYVSFVGTAARSYYGGGVKNLGFVAIGNATSGALLKMYRTIGATIEDVQFDGGYENLVLDGCADLFISDYYGVTRSRTGGTTSSFIRFKATEFVCSDVHLSNVQIKASSYTPTYSIIVNGSDGIYCTNGHQFGGLRFEPQGIGVTQSTSSTFWSNWYFDTSSSNNVIFVGNTDVPDKYNNHRFVGCDFRDGERGFTINSTTAIRNIILSESRVGFQNKDGFYSDGGLAADVIISNCIFLGNNTDNLASTGDIHLSVRGGVVTGCIFKGGGANGRAFLVGSGAQGCLISDCNFTASTAGSKLADSGANTVFGKLTGATASNSGTVVLPSGQGAVTVPHGCDVVPSLDTVVVTPITDAPGVTRWYADSRTATSFAIRTNTPPTADVTFAWQISHK